MIRAFTAALVPLALVALAGCSGASSETATTPRPTVPSSTPTVTPTPTPTPGPAGLAGLVLSPEGVGAIQIARPIDIAGPAAEFVTWDETICGFDDPAQDYAAWAPTLPYTADGHYPFFPMIGDFSQDSKVDRITVQSDEIRTAEGLGIGSPLTDLTLVYGSELSTTEIPDAGYTAHTIAGQNGQLIFWSEGAGTTVFTIEVLPRDAAVDFSFELGYCS